MVIRVIVVLIVALLASVAAACGDDDGSSDTGSTSTPSVCDQRDNLNQSVNDLAQLDVIAGGTDSLNAAIERVESDVDSLAAVTSSEVQAEVDALNDAIDRAEETFANLDDESLLAATAQVALTIADVAIAGEALVTALAVECD
ncbi:MAG: hypothetical protein IH865_13165 [Chloroflexi bacterium]|nr:hypothetical protein [Chloroflexota bacterium]